MKKFLMLGLLISVVAFGVEKTVDKKVDNEMLKEEITNIIEKAQMDMVKLSEKVKKEIKNDKDYEKIRNLMKETIEYNKKYLENLKEINKKIRKDIKEQWENQEINFDKIKENIEKEFTAKPDIIMKNNGEKTTK